ncbi:hypothetical protein SESBI_12083 [Sesbania bispinosa]|nr:hypothetical protein SESBI_12083 [Sesbania bispinosa]
MVLYWYREELSRKSKLDQRERECVGGVWWDKSAGTTWEESDKVKGITGGRE